MEHLVKTAEAASVLGVGRSTLLRLIHSGALPAVRLGPRLIRVSRGDLDRFIEHGALNRSHEGQGAA